MALFQGRSHTFEMNDLILGQFSSIHFSFCVTGSRTELCCFFSFLFVFFVVVVAVDHDVVVIIVAFYCGSYSREITDSFLVLDLVWK